MIWFTADTHFYHKNIMKYCERPFGTVEEMNSRIIAHWNGLVSPTDEIYHLGDFGFGRPELMCEILDKLNGAKYLIKGNHDHKLIKDNKFRSKFVWIRESYNLMTSGNPMIVLQHFPLAVWDESHRGTIHLHGHTHGVLPSQGLKRFDIGVDPMQYVPVSLQQVLKMAEANKVQKIWEDLPGVRDGLIKE